MGIEVVKPAKVIESFCANESAGCCEGGDVATGVDPVKVIRCLDACLAEVGRAAPPLKAEYVSTVFNVSSLRLNEARRSCDDVGGLAGTHQLV